MNHLRVIKRDLYKSIKTRGVFSTLPFVAGELWQSLKQLFQQKEHASPVTPKSSPNYYPGFDQKYGLDTEGLIRPSCMDVEDKNWIYGCRYQAIGSGLMDELTTLQISFEQFVFIDFGSGKGRAVLMASTKPFNKIIGVEYSLELTAIAKQNLLRFPKDLMKSHVIELLCQDAVEVTLPDQQLLLYFYNPFEEPIMQKIVDKVIKSYENSPRRFIIMYFTPLYAKLWDGVYFLNKCKSSEDVCIYDTLEHVNTAS